ncbi:6661_t:CDS:2, partial [Funneliformis geosporum]
MDFPYTVVHYHPDGTGVKIAPDVAVCPDIAFVSRPSVSTAKLYRQGMVEQRWDFGNAKKYSHDPVNDPTDCNAPNLATFQISIPICEVFWDPPLPIPPTYIPVIPTNVV